MKRRLVLVICILLVLTSVFMFSCKKEEESENGLDLNNKLVEIEKSEPKEFSIMSFNLRLLTLTDLGKKKWSKRKDYAAEIVTKNNPDIICFQEAKGSQPEDMAELLPNYRIIHYDRGDGEGLAIAFKQHYKLLEKGVFWLSETPDKQSKGFGATFYRICVYAALENTSTGEKITITNVHLDHISSKARSEGIKLVIQRMSKFSGALAICGDFNCSVGSDGYNAANEILQDSQAVAEVSETGGTFHDWGTKDPKEPIDFIFISEHYKVNAFEILDENKDGLYYSDHYAIMSTVMLKK